MPETDSVTLSTGSLNPIIYTGATRDVRVTRERYVELVALAMEAVQWLESKGLKQGEQCEFRQIAERLWFAPKGEK